jgi:formylglycine-generating enzyme
VASRSAGKDSRRCLSAQDVDLGACPCACSDWNRPDYYAQFAKAGGVAVNPQGPETSFDPFEPNEKKHVHRGGSFLCDDQYCSRYIVGTRGKGEVNTGTNHLAFRCVKSAEQLATK